MSESCPGVDVLMMHMARMQAVMAVPVWVPSAVPSCIMWPPETAVPSCVSVRSIPWIIPSAPVAAVVPWVVPAVPRAVPAAVMPWAPGVPVPWVIVSAPVP